MAQVHLRIAVRKRWFFWPAYYAMVVLAKLGIIRKFGEPVGWLVAHGLRVEAV